MAPKRTSNPPSCLALKLPPPPHAGDPRIAPPPTFSSSRPPPRGLGGWKRWSRRRRWAGGLLPPGAAASLGTFFPFLFRPPPPGGDLPEQDGLELHLPEDLRLRSLLLSYARYDGPALPLPALRCCWPLANMRSGLRKRSRACPDAPGLAAVSA